MGFPTERLDSDTGKETFTANVGGLEGITYGESACDPFALSFKPNDTNPVLPEETATYFEGTGTEDEGNDGDNDEVTATTEAGA